MSLKRAKRYKLKALAGVLAVLALAAAGVFVLPKFISADGALLWNATESFTVGTNRYPAIFSVAVDSSGLYVAGHATDSYGIDTWRVEKRSLTDGSVIWGASVGGGGDPAFSLAWADAIAVDSSGVYIGGVHKPRSTNDFELRVEKRSLTDGSLLWSVSRNISSRTERIYSIAVDSSAVYAVGEDYSPFGSGDSQWIIEKRNLSNGSLIWAVANNPKTAEDDAAYGVAVDSSGIYVVGYDNIPSGSISQWRVEKRSLSDGSLVTSFGTNGVVTSNPQVGRAIARGIAIDGASMYVTGTESAQWRVEKRSLSDGSLVTSFGTSGVIQEYISGVAQSPRAIVIDSSALYVGGDDNSPGNKQWRVAKRSLNDGSLLWAATNNPSGGSDSINGVAVDASGVYAVGYDTSSAQQQWRIEKRRTSVPPTAPAVTTQSAGSVGDSSAVLNGLANPNNGATTGWFRYDATSPGSCNDTFGTRAPSSGGTSLGSGSTNVSFSQTISGLNSTATYYFCAIAENSAGKSYGGVLNFTTAAPGAISSYGVTREGCELKNWGWGDEVAGWVSFNSTNNYGGKTPGASYGATLNNFCQNVAPNAPGNLAVTDTSSANWSFNCVSPLQPTFSWTFSDPNIDDSQFAYQLQVDNNSDFSSPEYDTGSATTTSLTTAVPPGSLSYNMTYNWRVKVWDNRKTPLASPWTTGIPFATTAHSWPSPDFTFLPNSPSVGQDTLFRRDQDSDGDGFGTRCFDASNNVIACGNYYWTMEDSSPAMSNTASSSIPVIVSFNSTGRKEVILKATDAEGFYCLKSRSTGTVTLPLPQYKEVLPR